MDAPNADWPSPHEALDRIERAVDALRDALARKSLPLPELAEFSLLITSPPSYRKAGLICRLAMTKLEERKRLILEIMSRHDRPVWVGDISLRASDQSNLAAAFRMLAEERKVKRLPGPKGARVYYRLVHT